MTAALLPNSKPPDVSLPAEQRLMLTSFDWEAYDRFLQLVEGRHVRVTYDRGSLEFMTVSTIHEIYKRLLAAMIDLIIDEFDLDACPIGNATWRKRVLDQGLESDDCWYIRNASKIAGRLDVDLSVDPPPDLALEVEVTRSVLDRISIYSNLRIPEVWRCDGKTVFFCVRQDSGDYLTTPTSLSFPQIASADLLPFLKMRESQMHTTVIRSFRDWLRARLH